MQLTESAKAARREYKRKWAQAHPEKVREQQRRYWERRAAQAEQYPQQPEPDEPAQ